jgi:pimeloyl-ACP methyl ester carboxylesterase
MELNYVYTPLATSTSTATEPALVLIHGMTSAAATFGSVAPQLATIAHVFAVDLRGHGKSREPEAATPTEYLAAFSIDAMAADVINFVETVVWGKHDVGSALRRVHLLGHSWGARVVCAVAASRPEMVESLIIEDEVMHRLPHKHDDDGARSRVARAQNMWRPRFPTEDDAVAFCMDTMQSAHGEQYRRKITKTSDTNDPYLLLFKPHVAIAWDHHATVFDCTSVWRTFPRTILVVCADDATSDVDPACREALAAEAAVMRAKDDLDRRLAHILGSSHSIHRSHPQEFVSVVCDFLIALTS